MRVAPVDHWPAIPRRLVIGLAPLVVVAACATGGSEAAPDEGSGAAPGVGPDAGAPRDAAFAPPGQDGATACAASNVRCGSSCVDTQRDLLHCGACDTACPVAANATTACTAGKCQSTCSAGFAPIANRCASFGGSHSQWSSQCTSGGCAYPNAFSNSCSCPAGTSEVTYHVETDCPGVATRKRAELKICQGTAVSAQSDFGGMYQVDDLSNWCNAPTTCRVGNPLAGGACACPAGFNDTITLRSIMRKPCNDDEAGTRIVVCGNKSASLTTFGGAYQDDDGAAPRTCRAPNPWTGACSCPPGTVDRPHRVMVDGNGIYGSLIHFCSL